ncbi:MAG: hypothetical protein GC162_14635 [Planctomycetes bacterium]|nr:hypothetical protein [Planctomycetota bacterium]
MTATPLDFDALLAGAIDQTIAPDDHQTLCNLLRHDPALRRQYIEHLLFDADMRWDHGASQSCGISTATPALPSASRNSVWNWELGVRSIAAIAALLVIAAALLDVFLPSTPHSALPAPHSAAPASFAILSDLSNDAAFAEGERALGEGLTAPIKLVSGKAQVMFQSTAVVDLTGPCEFEMTGPNRGRLISGTLNVYVPKNARGFTVDLPHGARVVDLGTAYDVCIKDNGEPSIQVSNGTVRVEWSDGSGSERSIVLSKHESAIFVDDPDPEKRVLKAITGVISIDFSLADSPVAKDDASHRASKFTFDGEQAGEWNVLDMGSDNRVRSNRALSCDTLTSGDGHATSARFDFNLGRGYWMPAYDPGYGDPLRDDRLTFNATLTQGDLTPLRWRIVGLVPSAMYRLILFAPKYQGKMTGQSLVFSVQGAAPDHIDGERDNEYTVGVRADASGVILGSVGLPSDHGDRYYGWSGLQIRGPLPIRIDDERTTSNDIARRRP